MTECVLTHTLHTARQAPCVHTAEGSSSTSLLLCPQFQGWGDSPGWKGIEPLCAHALRVRGRQPEQEQESIKADSPTGGYPFLWGTKRPRQRPNLYSRFGKRNRTPHAPYEEFEGKSETSEHRFPTAKGRATEWRATWSARDQMEGCPEEVSALFLKNRQALAVTKEERALGLQ